PLSTRLLGRAGLGRPRRRARGLGGLGSAPTALSATTAALRPVAAVPALPGTGAGGGRRLTLGPGGGGVALVNPHLHADAAEGGTGLVEAVVDVGAERVQGHAALAVELRTGPLGAAQAPRALRPDALRTAPHGPLHGPTA